MAGAVGVGAGASGAGGEVGGASEEVLVEMSDNVDDDVLSWMLIKEILGVRIEGAAFRSDDVGADSPVPAAVASCAASRGVRVEYLVHLRYVRERGRREETASER